MLYDVHWRRPVAYPGCSCLCWFYSRLWASGASPGQRTLEEAVNRNVGQTTNRPIQWPRARCCIQRKSEITGGPQNGQAVNMCGRISINETIYYKSAPAMTSYVVFILIKMLCGVKPHHFINYLNLHIFLDLLFFIFIHRHLF